MFNEVRILRIFFYLLFFLNSFSYRSWSWLYGSWIYNYICNQWLSPLTLWVRISLRWGVVDFGPLFYEKFPLTLKDENFATTKKRIKISSKIWKIKFWHLAFSDEYISETIIHFVDTDIHWHITARSQQSIKKNHQTWMQNKNSAYLPNKWKFWILALFLK